MQEEMAYMLEGKEWVGCYGVEILRGQVYAILLGRFGSIMGVYIGMGSCFVSAEW